MARARVGRTAGMMATVALLALAAPGAAQEGGAISQLSLEKGGLAWDGVGLGNSLVSAERRIGVTLALDRNSEAEANRCAPFVAVADHHGLQLTLGFKSPRPGAKIDWMRVRFEGQQVAASASDLAAELKARIPGAEWIPPAGSSDLVEEDDLMPTYRVPAGKQTQAVRFAPREYMEVGALECFE